jgi:co-chaperonin GroES (HSP10)
MVVTPLGSNVFVELIAVGERMTKSGLHLPGVHQEPSRLGKVLGIGPDVKRVKAGDNVMINFFSGTGIDYLDSGFHYDTHRIVNETDLLMTYTD